MLRLPCTVEYDVCLHLEVVSKLNAPVLVCSFYLQQEDTHKFCFFFYDKK